MALFEWDVGDKKIPDCRSGHVSCQVNDSVFMWGGYHNIRQSFGPDGHNFVHVMYMDPSAVWFYYPMINKWKRLITSYPYPNVSSGSGAVFVPSKMAVYLFFGFSADRYKNCIYSFDLLQHKWHCITEGTSENTRMPSPRDKFALWEYRRKVYVFGGYGSPLQGYLRNTGNFDRDTEVSGLRGWNDQLLEFDVEAESWTEVQCSGSVPPSRAAHAATVVRDGVYLFGGRHKSQRLNELHHLDLRSLSWTRILTFGLLPPGRSWHTLGHLRDTNCLVVVGGYSQGDEVLGDVWLHDIAANKWSPCHRESQVTKRFWHSMTVTEEGDAVIFGGIVTNMLQELAIHLSDLTILRFSPESLFRSTLNMILKNRGIFEYQLCILPKSCQNLLLNLWQLSDS